jgi:GDP-D-mannose 3',5'-epimerase
MKLIDNLTPMRILVCGAGGFIGGHLVKSFLGRPNVEIVAVDIKPLAEWHQIFPDAESVRRDLALLRNCEQVMEGVDVVYNLAADMGGMGFIEKNKGLCMLSVLINTHLLLAARDAGVKRYFYASSACVYAAGKQNELVAAALQGRETSHLASLREQDAYPADPEDGYGWEKLFSERMCRHFREDFGLETRVARLHNVYGPHGTWQGGREKAPAAICRKVIEAKLKAQPEIEIWGDGKQVRSFMWIQDCLAGIEHVMSGSYPHPINLGSAEQVTINHLVTLVERIADVRLVRTYNLEAPKGVQFRSSDNTLIQRVYQWEPLTPLNEGLKHTYAWIEKQILSQ